MADGGYSAEKIAQAAPPKADFFRHGPVLCNDLWKAAMYVISPFDVIPIRWIPQPGEESKLEMVMCIDEAREEQIAIEVDGCVFRRCIIQSIERS